MRRTALRVFFERVIVATLPLAGCGGSGGNDLGPAPVADLSSAVVSDLAGAQNPPNDLAGAIDLGNVDLDTCEPKHPITWVPIAQSMIPDAGHFNTLCVKGDPCTTVCPTGYMQCCSPTMDTDMGTWQVSCVYNCGPSGRRPAGLADAALAGGCDVGRYFAAMAHLEAASVHAFRVMARELAAHGAPSSLIDEARAAARDEIRHARLMRAWARAHRAPTARVTVAASAPRALEEIAVENAVEGCVRETYGALLACWQARAAAEPRVRTIMAAVAADETRHAQLAWSLDAWSKRRLDRAARRRVVEERRRAAQALAVELTVAPPAELARVVGLPDPDRARQLHAALLRERWA